MEEAEALSDRIMIMKEGEMVCIGDSLSLKEKYAQFYTVSLTVKERNSEKIRGILMEELGKGVEISVYNGGILKLMVDFSGVKSVFRLMRDDGFKGLIVDWEFSQPSLDDVFMNLAEA